MSDMGWLMFGIGFFFIVAAMIILGTKSLRSTEDQIVTFNEYNIEVIGKTDPDTPPLPSLVDTPPLPPSHGPTELPLRLGQLRTEGCEGNDDEGCVILNVASMAMPPTPGSVSVGTGSEHPTSPCSSSCSCVHPFSASATLQTVNSGLSLNGTFKRETWTRPDTPSSLPPRPGTAPPAEGVNGKAGFAWTDPPRPSTAVGAGDGKAAPRLGSIAPMPVQALALMRARAAEADPSPAPSPEHDGTSFSGVAVAVAAANALRGAAFAQAGVLAPPTLPALPSTLGKTAEPGSNRWRSADPDCGPRPGPGGRGGPPVGLPVGAFGPVPGSGGWRPADPVGERQPRQGLGFAVQFYDRPACDRKVQGEWASLPKGKSP